MTKSAKDQPIGLDTFVQDRDSLIALAKSFVRSSAIAEELVQDSWLRWHGRHYPAEKAAPILRRIVRNLALDWHRRQKSERSGLEAQKLTIADAPDSETVVMARQELLAVARVLAELPDRTLTAFRMYRLEGRTYAEIARHLDIVPSRAHQLVRNALVHMALRLTDQD
ncbi:MAG: sigma-70 family RNA polymerase sigma factor [Pseudomonadota bacterium]